MKTFLRQREENDLRMRTKEFGVRTIGKRVCAIMKYFCGRTMRLLTELENSFCMGFYKDAASMGLGRCEV